MGEDGCIVIYLNSVNSPVLERLGKIPVVGGRKRIESRVLLDWCDLSTLGKVRIVIRPGRGRHHELCECKNIKVLSSKYWWVAKSQRP